MGVVAVQPLDDEGARELKRLYVDPDFRNQGTGYALATAIVEEARGRGHDVMRLDTVAFTTSGPAALPLPRLQEAGRRLPQSARRRPGYGTPAVMPF